MFPLKTPCAHRNITSELKFLDHPKPTKANANPSGPSNKTGLLPKRSEARPQEYTDRNSATKNTDSYDRRYISFPEFDEAGRKLTSTPAQYPVFRSSPPVIPVSRTNCGTNGKITVLVLGHQLVFKHDDGSKQTHADKASAA